VLSDDLAWLSMAYFVQKTFPFKSRSRRKSNSNKRKRVLAPNFWGEGRPRLFYGRLLARFTTVWRSLVEFRLLITLYEAWQ